MLFRDYLNNWKKEFESVSKNMTWRRSWLADTYLIPLCGDVPIEQITVETIKPLFQDKRFMEMYPKTVVNFHGMMIHIFDDLVNQRLIKKNPMVSIPDPFLFYYEYQILERDERYELTPNSQFCVVSFGWLKDQGYKPVTYNLYLLFLKEFVHPFIGSKPIASITPSELEKIHRFFNVLATNEVWIEQIHRVMKMVFDDALSKKIIQESPMDRLNEPKSSPVVQLNQNQKNAVRNAFMRYGFRKERKKELVSTIFFALKGNAFSQGEGKTFAEVYFEWFENTQNGVLSKQTANAGRILMNNYVLPCFGDIPINLLTVDDLLNINNVYLLLGNNPNPTINIKFHSLFSYAHRKRYIKEDISKSLVIGGKIFRKRDVLSDDEIKRFLQLCETNQYGELFAITLLLGLRIREALALSWDNYNADASSIRVKGQVRNRKLILRTKTGKPRNIALSKSAIFFFNKAKEKQLQWSKSPNYSNPDHAIFTHEDGSYLSFGRMEEHFKRFAVQFGRSDLTPHVLRHTFLTISARVSDNIQEIQSSSGHSKKSYVLAEYIHPTEEAHIQAAEGKQKYLEALKLKYES